MPYATYTLDPEVRDRLVAVVGADAALQTPEERATFRDPYWNADDDTYDSSLVLMPTSVDEIQDIVRICAAHAVPVWPSSQGRNNGYGGPSGRVQGSVLLSMRRMNRVLEIDRELAYAVVEPGVSWFELREALDASGNEDLWFSIPDLGWGSVIGNSLDNGLTYGPNGSDFQKLCGLEVVLGTGEILRTGLGGQPGNDSWHLYTRGFGPVLDPLFMQSNLGIVTRAGIWLMRRPEAFAPLFLTIPRHAQLAQAIDIFRELRLDGVVRGVPSIQNFVTMSAQFDHTRHLYLRADEALDEESLDRLGDESGLGRWGARTALWGDRPVVEHHLQRIRDAWSQIEGGKVLSNRIYGRDEWDQITSFVDKVQAGIPSMDIVQATPSHIAHAFFAPVLPLRGELVARTIDLMRDTIVEEVGNNHVCALYFPNDRTCIVVNPLTFDVDDADVNARAYGALRRLVREGGERGYTEYRAHIDLMDLVADQLSFNDHAYRRFVERIKDAVDPAGVIAPGRNGIWPAKRRDGGEAA
ncbi:MULTISPECIES: FAD-binding oxidoreductase [Microbacterium]|uniref:FAD-binding oxidoreductase n=1 Tax=Microbacterium TaxID=33882 RepID=UPI002785B782|nr:MULTISPECIES: FAD-binding oxidoreductase [Microbacterium]MDQ1075152.1 4-cresol dehydrogenase (hydroxylating) [Microbacterium sp. SORGH_AS_0969]MDQ1115383.1 4-cresol dehydrogenase (hydroxylating) [Microbacterium testaceum]